jgi:hypothetical protein
MKNTLLARREEEGENDCKLFTKFKIGFPLIWKVKALLKFRAIKAIWRG